MNTDTIECPRCDGGRTPPVGIGCGDNACKIIRYCMRCNGTGRVEPDELEKIAAGERFRHDRELHDESLRETARRLELPVVKVSMIERGTAPRAVYERLGLLPTSREGAARKKES